MDKKALIKALRDTVQSASNTVASGVSAPVDLIAAGLRKVGLPIPQAPVGGSQWMENMGLTVPVEEGIPKLAGETLGMIVPMAATAKAPQIAAAANRGLENLTAPRTLNTPKYGGQRGAVGFAYPQQEALDIAQRNAAKPVSEGGLGLPPNNTAMDRAKAMGFDTDAYHATDFDIRNLDKAFLGLNTKAPSAKKAFFSAKHPRTTYAYIDKGVTGTDPTHTVLYGKSADQIRKEIEVEAAKKGLKPYQIRDQYYENLPNIFLNNLDTLAKQRTEIRKQIPGHSVLGKHFPDMEKATPQQIQALNSVEDAIEELNAIREMAFRTQFSLNEVDDIVEHAGKATNAGANIMPLKLRTQNAQYFDDANQGYRNDTFSNRIDEAIANKKDLAVIQNTQDGFKQTDTIYGVINPAIIRSRFAAFDPAKINQSDLLGYADPRLLGLMGIGTGVGLGLYNYLGK